LGTISKGEFVPNLACALLFAKDPQLVAPGCRVRFLRYMGTVEKTGEEYNVIKDIVIDGTVPELIQNSAEIVETQIREFVRLGKDQRFYSVSEYPKPAWYEALVNACVHRSYTLKNMNIFVKMFDDRLVIESPGGFPPFVTPDNIYDMHQPRNPYLMDAMFYMRFVQAAHEGTRRMRDAMRAMGLPEPIFSQKEVGSALVQVALKNDIEHRKEFVDTEAFLALGPALARSLNEHERRVVNFVIENRTINVTQTKDLLNRRWHFGKKVLTGLVERDVLDLVHSRTVERDSFAYYTLPKRLSDRIARHRAQ
jgi:ATP-dependent DNA helicase RecG